MTNAQMAHKMGLDTKVFCLSHYMDAVKRCGMEIVDEELTVLETKVFTAKVETSRGALKIVCGGNGTARVDKPNGTHKWVYEKTPNQIAALLKQTMDCYK